MKQITLLITLFLATLTYAQPTLQWESNTPGPTNGENHTVATDLQGNVYTTGTYTTSYDFDPGQGVFTMTCFQTNMFILKLDAAGNFVWAKQIGGGTSLSYSQGNAVTVDAQGNVYVAGTATGFFGPIDFDPGVGVYNLTTPMSEADIFIEKLDSNGNFVWADQIRNPTDTSYGLDNAQCLKVDLAGNLYVTGGFGGTADFDPGTGTFNLTSTGNFLSTNAFILKLDNSGGFVWAKAMTNATTTNDSVTDKGYGIDVDTAGNVYTTGYFWGSVDADPGSGVYNLTAFTSNNPVQSGANALFVSKLDAAGNFIWAHNLAGDHNMGFHPSIAVDASDNLILAGYSSSSMSAITDYDFGTGTAYLPVGTGAFVLKMDSSANLIWVKSTARSANGTNSWGKGLAVDAAGNIYTLGDFYDQSTDFDPGNGSYNYASSSVDLYVSKLDTNGNFIFAEKIGGTGVDDGFSISVSASGNITIWGTAGNGGIARSTSSVAAGGFLASLEQTGLATIPISSADEIVIFPNPSQGWFNIRGNQALIGAQVAVFNLPGQEIARFQIDGVTTGFTLPKGVYLLNISLHNQNVTKKLVVE